MIDGIMNNPPLRKAEKMEQIAENTSSLLSKLKAVKEMDIQKKSTVQKKNELER